MYQYGVEQGSRLINSFKESHLESGNSPRAIKIKNMYFIYYKIETNGEIILINNRMK